MDTTWIGCSVGNFRKERPVGMKPEIIVVHSLDGSLADGDLRFNKQEKNLSAHYAVGSSGEIHQYVMENDTAFHAGYVVNPAARLVQERPGVNPNFYSIGIEHEGKPGEPLTPAQAAASAALIRDLAARWGIPLDRDHVIGHSEIRASVNCPGAGFDIVALLATPAATIPPPAATSTVTLNSNVNLRSRPSVNSPVVKVVASGSALAVRQFVTGDMVNGNAIWYQDKDGNYFWAGATDAPHPQRGDQPVETGAAAGPDAGTIRVLTTEQLSHIMPACRNPQTWVSALNPAMARFEITTAERMTAFLAQIAHESGQLTRLSENLNYTAARLMQVWPKRFSTMDKALQYERNEQKLANYVYAKRIGNGDEASGDGWNYRGRGLIQLTGRGNYRSAAQGTGLPLEEQPDLLLQPGPAALSAAWFWKSHGLNALADDQNDDNDTEDFETITIKINGGTVGLKERLAFWGKAKEALLG